MFICSFPCDEVATVRWFLMRESLENGGNPMLARQVRVAPSSLVVVFLSVLKWKSTSIQCHKKFLLGIKSNIIMLTFVIADINISP